MQSLTVYFKLKQNLSSPSEVILMPFKPVEKILVSMKP